MEEKKKDKSQKFVDFMVEKSQRKENPKPYKSTDVDIGNIESITEQIRERLKREKKKGR